MIGEFLSISIIFFGGAVIATTKEKKILFLMHVAKIAFYLSVLAALLSRADLEIVNYDNLLETILLMIGSIMIWSLNEKNPI